MIQNVKVRPEKDQKYNKNFQTLGKGDIIFALRGCYPRRVSVIPEFSPVDDNIHREYYLGHMTKIRGARDSSSHLWRDSE